MAGCLAAAVLPVAGCAAAAAVPVQPIGVGSAYVLQPSSGSAAAYFIIDNPGPADSLTGARTSAGGQVSLVGPAAGSQGGRTIRSISIPARAVLRLTPAGYHLLITGARGLRAGRQLVITLSFAHGGPIRVGADVMDPQSGGSSYFGA